MKRLQKLEEIRERSGSECVIITAEPNLYYYVNFEGAGSLVLCDGRSTLVVPELERNRAMEAGLEVVSYFPFKITENTFEGSLLSVFQKLLDGHKKIGIDMNWLNSTTFLQLKNLLSDLIDVSDLVLEQRSVKDDMEISMIKEAGKITSSAMKVGMEKVLSGNVSEKQVAGYIDMTMKEEGAEDYAFPSIVAFAENSSKPHHIPSDKVFEKGMPAVVDIGAKYNGYCFDSTRTFIPSPKEEVRKIYEIVLQSQLEAIDQVRDGAKASEVDMTARKVIERSGYGKYFIHSTGHGVGIEVHEKPYVSFTSRDILKENMIVTVEPGIYIPNKFGIRIEDTIVVTKGKPEVLETSYKLL
jgi:Xaa-Pro dipeptidase